MAEIIGFRGVRYDPKRVGAPLVDLVAPPYDVISPQEQAALYEKNPRNVVRLILGREEDRYPHAAKQFRDWLADGTLVVDNAEAVYVYRQSFRDPMTGEQYPERVGLVCLLKLEEYEAGGVLPHENTLTAAKADRLELLRATRAQFESIYGLYSDPDRAIRSFLAEYDDREPVMETVDDAIGSSHAVERLSDVTAVGVLQDLLRDKKIFIADGHHRYETALNYRREVRTAQNVPATETIAADYILITLTAFEDEGLLVLPTHRLVRGIAPEKVDGLIAELGEEFTVENIGDALGTPVLEKIILEKAKTGQVAFGIVLPNGSYVATLNAKPADLASIVGGSQSKAVKRLPVTLLHSLLLEQRLGIGAEALAAGGQVTYERDAAAAAQEVRSGAYQAAFILGRPEVEEVRDVSLAGDKMPQKSTFFFPKLLSGLLLRDLQLSLDDD